MRAEQMMNRLAVGKSDIHKEVICLQQEPKCKLSLGARWLKREIEMEQMEQMITFLGLQSWHR